MHLIPEAAVPFPLTETTGRIRPVYLKNSSPTGFPAGLLFLSNFLNDLRFG